MDLIGREHPAGLLSTAVDRAVASHGGLVLVGGEPGIGKTTLVTAAADEARRRGALVLGAACWASGSAPGYWPWVQVVRGLRRSPDDWELAREAAEPGLRRLLGEAPTTEAPTTGIRGVNDEGFGEADQGDGDEEAFALHDAVTTALVAVSQRRTVVVLLDDLHWADPASMRLLQFAAQHTWFERLLLIGTYRDAEVESADHLLLPLTAKATTITLDGLSRDEVGALITRTAGREPGPELLDEVHRRTGGNPFFVEQTARLWRVDGEAGAVAPGVREVVRQRLAQLPAAVVEALTVAAVLGREFHRQVLADCVPSPVAETDRLLGRAVTARLVVSRSGGRFAFVHDLVRETLYDGLGDEDRRARHAAVVRAAERSAALAERLLPGELAGHAWLAGPGVDPAHATDLLLVAARAATRRLASDEAVMHFRRALDVVADPAQRTKTMVEFGQTLRHHHGDRAAAERLMADAAAIALDLDDPVVLARVAITVYRNRHSAGSATDPERLLREAHRRLIGEPASAAAPGALVTDLITATETLARKGQDDEALTFTLWARHDTTWGLGTAADRAALTAEIRDVARRTGDVETELWATSLRWVALLELGDPGYYRELTAMARLGRGEDSAAYRIMLAIDGGVVAGFRGDFAEADACYTELESFGEWTDGDHAFTTPHLRWAWLLPQGRFPEIDALLDRPDLSDRDYVQLLRAITAAERGDAGTAARLTSAIEAAGVKYGRAVSPLWHRLRAEVAAASGDPGRCAEVREVLRPYRGQWLVALFGCDVSGPVDHWLARLDLAERRWDDAVAGFRAAGEAADRMGSRHWSLLARAGLVEALSGRGQAEEAAALRAAVAEQARALGMPHVAGRLGARPAAPPDEPPPADHEFRFDGAVWQLAYAGTIVHLPDAKGLHDLRLLLSRPGVDVPVAELLDPSAGPELAAACRLGGDPVLDDEAKARYRHHLGLLDEEIDRAAVRGDEPRLAALDAERAALLEQLRAAAGLAGRTRRLGNEAERARKTVTARIRDTLRRLDERHPALAAHLRETVSTGGACSYRPPSPPPWRL
ncbi:AAA family ATPase [Dactylosporangium sp. NPDC051484]|uniref:ATP-binding protein n=1 Tax=Dactylosporangium sp. NPDC051484 TaxID=3154942 RepID=UPI00344B6924